LATDGENRRGYDPSVIDAVLTEAAHLLRHLGFAAQHTVLIGGVVPSLLVLDPPRGPHLGTTDLDVCLSLAIVEGDTAEYERIEVALGKGGYESTTETFRWRQRDRMHLTVEFFCPSGDGRPPGRAFRPKHADNPVAKQNLGSRLSALALDAGRVLDEDVVVVDREVVLPDGGGRTIASFRVTGVLGFLVAKTGALIGRDKPKDAYDIVWILENWDGGPAAVAAVIAASPAHGRDEAQLALDRLLREFAAPDSLGPSSYVRFMAEPGMTANDRARLARQAAGAVGELGRALSDR